LLACVTFLSSRAITKLFFAKLFYILNTTIIFEKKIKLFFDRMSIIAIFYNFVIYKDTYPLMYTLKYFDNFSSKTQRRTNFLFMQNAFAFQTLFNSVIDIGKVIVRNNNLPCEVPEEAGAQRQAG